jgi:hypothetical protein
MWSDDSKALGIASEQEVDKQNNVLERLHGKTDNVDREVRSATDRVSGPHDNWSYIDIIYLQLDRVSL